MDQAKVPKEQRSTEGDARRELMQAADRVLREDADEVVIRVRRGRDGQVHVFPYEPSTEEVSA